MNVIRCRSMHWLGALTLFCLVWPIDTRAGGCAVSDGSVLPEEDGCKLAFVYNQEGDHRLVVLDEKTRHRYEAPLDNSRMAPFWEGGRIYVVAHSGSVQGFTIGAEKLIPEKLETISPGVVRDIAYSRSLHRLYLIRTSFDGERRIHYELSAIDFPGRRSLWTKKLDNPGLLTVLNGYLCVAGQKLVEVFNSDTGAKAGGIDATKGAVPANADRNK
jgi:hypothetical protein